MLKTSFDSKFTLYLLNLDFNTPPQPLEYSNHPIYGYIRSSLACAYKRIEVCKANILYIEAV